MNDEPQNPIAKWPFGAATLVKIPAEGVINIGVYNTLTIVDGAATAAIADRTLDLEIGGDIEPGARLIVKTKTTATETFTPGRGMAGTVTTGVAGKTKVTEYVFDGSKFIQTAAAVQID